MASLLKAFTELAEAKTDGKGRSEVSQAVDEDGEKTKPRRDKVLLICSRGVTLRMRHLMRDLEILLPHTKKGRSPSVPLHPIGWTLMHSLRSADSKLDSKSSLHLLNELSDLHSCTNTLYLEARRHEDLYLWLSRSPNGPSVKCHVQNVHTMDELKMTGNCLKGSRGVCVFDGAWEGEECWRLMKEMFTHVSGARLDERRRWIADRCWVRQVFSVPKTSRRLKPFVDHIMVFSILDSKVWFRNYQVGQWSSNSWSCSRSLAYPCLFPRLRSPIRLHPTPPYIVAIPLRSRLSSLPSSLPRRRSSPPPSQIIEKDPLHPSGPPQSSLIEIGPRFVLTPIRIFEGSFGGPTVFENPEFVSPASVRASMKRDAGHRYRGRKEREGERGERGKRRREEVPEDELGRGRVFA